MIFVALTARVAIGTLFVASGILKLLDPAAFAWTIYQYGIVPRQLIDPIALGLPLLEIAAGGGLLLDRRWSYAAVFSMLACFVSLLGYALANGLNVDCGCFGSSDPGPVALRNAILRDVIMLVGIAAAWWTNRKRSVQGRTDGRNDLLIKEEIP